MSDHVTIHIINAFTDGNSGGNPAGVVINANEFDQAQKQRIAAEAGLSETAFISDSEVADFKFEFFTPTRQIAHCGHATIAAFSYLAQQGKVPNSKSSKETIDGTRAIFIRGDRAFMEQKAPHYQFDGLDTDVIMTTLGLKNTDLVPGYKPLIVNTGNSFMIVPLENQAALAGIRPNFDTIEQISNTFDLIGYYPFTLETQRPGHHAAARMFAPAYGIPEESATGMAAGPLACYLYDQLGIKQRRLVIEQGWFMSPPSPSEIIVDLAVDEEHIVSLMAGGHAKLMHAITVQI